MTKVNWESFIDGLAKACEMYNDSITEEEKAERRTAFEDEHKAYNRGSVMAAMAEQQWDSYDMKRVLKAVSTPEHAEAAVGLVKSGAYDAYDIARLLEAL